MGFVASHPANRRPITGRSAQKCDLFVEGNVFSAQSDDLACAAWGVHNASPRRRHFGQDRHCDYHCALHADMRTMRLIDPEQVFGHPHQLFRPAEVYDDRRPCSRR